MKHGTYEHVIKPKVNSRQEEDKMEQDSALCIKQETLEDQSEMGEVKSAWVYTLMWCEVKAEHSDGVKQEYIDDQSKTFQTKSIYSGMTSKQSGMMVFNIPKKL